MFLTFNLFQAVQEERGPRKTTRLKKLISTYGAIQRGKIYKSSKEKDPKLHLENNNLTIEPNYGTLEMYGKLIKDARFLNHYC